MQRKTKKAGNPAMRVAGGPMRNKQDKRHKQKFAAEVDRQLEEYQMKKKEGR